MDFENENKQDGQLSEQSQGGREGYQSDSGNYSKDYHALTATIVLRIVP